MDLFDVISNDIKEAMKAKDKVKLETLRNVKKFFLEAGLRVSVFSQRVRHAPVLDDDHAILELVDIAAFQQSLQIRNAGVRLKHGGGDLVAKTVIVCGHRKVKVEGLRRRRHFHKVIVIRDALCKHPPCRHQSLSPQTLKNSPISAGVPPLFSSSPPPQSPRRTQHLQLSSY